MPDDISDRNGRQRSKDCRDGNGKRVAVLSATQGRKEEGGGVEDGEEGWMKYTVLETSNKINVVSGDSIRKTHRTISHTILRQNDHDSYLLHGRRLPLFPRRPFASSLVLPFLDFAFTPLFFLFLQNNPSLLVDLIGK